MKIGKVVCRNLRQKTRALPLWVREGHDVFADDCVRHCHRRFFGPVNHFAFGSVLIGLSHLTCCLDTLSAY